MVLSCHSRLWNLSLINIEGCVFIRNWVFWCLWYGFYLGEFDFLSTIATFHFDWRYQLLFSGFCATEFTSTLNNLTRCSLKCLLIVVTLIINISLLLNLYGYSCFFFFQLRIDCFWLFIEFKSLNTTLGCLEDFIDLFISRLFIAQNNWLTRAVWINLTAHLRFLYLVILS